MHAEKCKTLCLGSFTSKDRSCHFKLNYLIWSKGYCFFYSFHSYPSFALVIQPRVTFSWKPWQFSNRQSPNIVFGGNEWDFFSRTPEITAPPPPHTHTSTHLLPPPLPLKVLHHLRASWSLLRCVSGCACRPCNSSTRIALSASLLPPPSFFSPPHVPVLSPVALLPIPSLPPSSLRRLRKNSAPTDSLI